MELMDITTMLGTLTTVFTALGGVGVWMYKKQNRLLKEAEVKLADLSVDKGRIEAKKQEDDRLLAQVDHQQRTIDTLMERCDSLIKQKAEQEKWHQESLHEKNAIIRRQRSEIEQHLREHARQDKIIDHLKYWKCIREENDTDEGCKRREPKQPVPTKYVPLEEECAECDVEDCAARITKNEE